MLTVKVSRQKIKDLNKLPELLRVYLQNTLDYIGGDLEQQIKLKLTGQVLNVQTGRLRSSITHGQYRTKDSMFLRVGTNVIYARIHELGGDIVPVTRQYLTVPFPGVKGYARDYDNTFIAKGIIFQRLSKDKIRPLFSLRESVHIPPRPYLYSTLQENRDKIRSTIAQAVRDVVGRL